MIVLLTNLGSLYGNKPYVKKLCAEHGIHLPKPVKMEEDEVESTETADSREAQPLRRTTRLRTVSDRDAMLRTEMTLRSLRNTEPKKSKIIFCAFETYF